MKWLESRLLWGLLLILGGVLFLLQNLNILELGNLFWGLLLGLGGVFFVSVFLQHRDNWWALIPGFTLMGLGALILLEQIAPALTDLIGGSIVLGSISLAFIAVYAADRDNWWAIIPAGVLATLAVVASLGDNFILDSGGLLFLGLGATFALVAVLPTTHGPMRWAWIPSGILTAMGLLILIAAEDLIGTVWPLFLIAAGGLILLNNLRPRAHE